MENSTNKYFNRSGCLTLEALEKYSTGEMEKDDDKIVQKHLTKCELCRDALVGLELIKDKDKLNSIISEINDNLNKTLADDKKAGKSTGNKIFYYSAAAVIIVLFGIFGYLKFLKSKYSNNIAENQVIKKIEMPVPKMPVAETSEKQTGDTNKINVAKEKLQYITLNLSDTEPEDFFDDELEISEDFETTQMKNERKTTGEDESFLIEMVIINGEENIKSGPAAPSFHIKPDNETSGNRKNPPKSNNNTKKPKNEKTIAQSMPQFPGGEKGLREYLIKNLKYPVKARNKGIEGKVYISFIVDKTGKVTNVRILKGIDPGCDAEAIRIIRAIPQWIPGTQNGNPVDVGFVIPVCFKLN